MSSITTVLLELCGSGATLVRLAPPHLPSSSAIVTWYVTSRLLASVIAWGRKYESRLQAIALVVLDLAWLLMSLPWLSALEFNGQGVTMDVLGVLAAGNGTGTGGLNGAFYKRLAVSAVRACTLYLICTALALLLGRVPCRAQKPNAHTGGAEKPRTTRMGCAWAVLETLACVVLLVTFHPLVTQTAVLLQPRPLRHRAGHGRAVIEPHRPGPGTQEPAAVAEYHATDAEAPLQLSNSSNSSYGISADSDGARFLYFWQPRAQSIDGRPPRLDRLKARAQAQGSIGPRALSWLPNIVFIVSEALEESFFDQRLYPGLFPSLTDLSTRALRFTNLEAAHGATMSIAGETALYCSIAFPFPPDHPNDWIAGVKSMERQAAFFGGTTCLMDVLAQLGYHIELHVGADATFNGVSNLIGDHGGRAFIDNRHMVSSRAYVGPSAGFDYFKEFSIDSKAYHKAGGWDMPAHATYWGVTDDVTFNVSRQRIQQLKEAREMGLPELAELPPSMASVITRNATEGAEHHQQIVTTAPGAPFMVLLTTMDMHYEPEPSPSCEAIGRGVFSRPGKPDDPMLKAAHCEDLQLAALIEDIVDDNTIVVVAGDHQNKMIDLRLESLAWNKQRDRDLGVTYHGDPSERRQDGRAPDESCRVFAMIYGPKWIQPGVIDRRATQYDLAPTLLDAMGLDVVALGMGRSLLRPQEPTLPEWAAARGIDFNLELQEWTLDPGVRASMWSTEKNSSAGQDCQHCCIRTYRD